MRTEEMKRYEGVFGAGLNTVSGVEVKAVKSSAICLAVSDNRFEVDDAVVAVVDDDDDDDVAESCVAARTAVVK